MEDYNKEQYQNMMPDYSNQDDADQQNIYLRVGFGRRFGAWLIDGISLAALSVVMIMTLDSFGYFSQNGIDFKSFMDFSLSNFEKMQTQMEEFSMLILPFSVIISLLYYSMEIFLGASLGKILLNIKIANENRTDADLQKLLIRYLTKHSNLVMSLLYVITTLLILNQLGSIFGLVIFLGSFAVLGYQKKALHDYIAGTAVYYKDEITDETLNIEQKD